MVSNSENARKEGYGFLPNPREPNAASFAAALRFPFRGKRIPDRFHKEYQKQHQLVLQQLETQEESQEPLLNWVISAEGLCVFDKMAIARLRDFLSGYNVTVVAFVRNHLDHFRSYWLTNACYLHRVAPSLPEHLEKEANEVLAGKGILGEEMFRSLDKYERAFGNGSIVLIDFDGALANKNTSLPQALLNDVVGLKFNPVGANIHANSNQRFVTTVNLWSALGPTRTPKCESLWPLMLKLKKKFEELDLLERCEDRLDTAELSRKLDKYFEEGFQKRGWEVMYKREGKGKKRESEPCLLVKEDRLDEAKEIGRQFVLERERKWEEFFKK